MPGDNIHEVCYKWWDGTLHYGRVSSYHVLIVHFWFVLLLHHWGKSLGESRIGVRLYVLGINHSSLQGRNLPFHQYAKIGLRRNQPRKRAPGISEWCCFPWLRILCWRPYRSVVQQLEIYIKKITDRKNVYLSFTLFAEKKIISKRQNQLKYHIHIGKCLLIRSITQNKSMNNHDCYYNKCAIE